MGKKKKPKISAAMQRKYTSELMRQGFRPDGANFSTVNYMEMASQLHYSAQYVQAPVTEVWNFMRQPPVQPQYMVTPKKKMQPTGMNNQRPVTNTGINQLPMQPKRKKKKKKKQLSGGKIQGPGINMIQLTGKSKNKVTPEKKMQPTGTNMQQQASKSANKPGLQSSLPSQDSSATVPSTSGGTGINQLPVQSECKENPEKKKQPTELKIQRPGIKLNLLPATAKKKLQPTGTGIQQQASKSANEPDLQSSLPGQDLSTTVASTSGGAESAAAPKQVIDVDLTDDEVIVLEHKSTKVVMEVVDLTEDDPEVNPTKEVMKDTKEVIEVDSTNAAHLLAAQPSILSDIKPDVWHKVTVKSAVIDRLAFLNAINKQCAPLKLIPYFFCEEDGHITFLVNNCSGPLTTLFRQNLKVPFLSDEIELKVQLHAKKVNLSKILQSVVSKRLSTEKTFLDLSQLTSIPEIQELLYHPWETSDLQQELLKTAQVMVPNLVILSLAGNDIATLNHLTSVFTDRTKWRSLTVLDVSDNKITTAFELAIFKNLSITELYLHKNPVCGKYIEESAYISVVRVIFPRLIKLDGTYLQRMPGLPRWRPNYIPYTPRNSGELADQFVEHFFTLYDSEDRSWLWELYHNDAYFSVSSLYLSGQSTSHSARLSAYIAECRNLLHPSNKLRSKATLCRGAEQVLAKLQRLPRTQHDPYSFTVDLLHHSHESAILTVTGVFREQNQNRKHDISPRHFMRTFVLVQCVNNEYQIINDIMYVTNATTEEAEAAFRYSLPIPKKSMPRRRQVARRQVTESDKTSMTGRFSQLTGMTIEWSRKCLCSSGWNLRRALEIFISLYKAGRIPAERFIKNQKEVAKS